MEPPRQGPTREPAGEADPPDGEEAPGPGETGPAGAAEPTEAPAAAAEDPDEAAHAPGPVSEPSTLATDDSASGPPPSAEPSTAEPAAPASEPSPRRRRPLRAVALALAAFLLGFAAWELLTWPDVAALAATDPETTAFIELYKRRHGGTAPAWRPVRYGSVSVHLKHAVVVAEDIDFFSHDGFAWEEVKKAFAEARQRRELPRGASTLTQQLAKNLWLTPSYNPWRKAKEALLTVQLERHLAKRRILELYLNVAEFGPGVYGAEAAARHYFGTSAAALGPRQAAALAAGLPRPSAWHPGSASRTYQRRVERIAGRMAKTAWVRKEL